MNEQGRSKESAAAELLAALSNHGSHIFNRDVTALKFKRISADAFAPRYATDGSACFDLFATEAAIIDALAAGEVGTGLAFEIPATHVMLIFSRSGHGFKNGVRLSNCVGVIDSDFRGEVRISLCNDSEYPFGVEAGHRIAQAMLIPIPFVNLVEVDELTSTARGAAGFGSTGH